jgi:NADH dehydrogenase [ubiquinone] 1 alpha subcomplex assembly factor 7
MTAGITPKIVRRIRAEGPLTVAGFMAMALHDPESGYYAMRDPIGGKGDFTTAPEISQVFGELIGIWCADLWQRMGQPDPVIVAELGPGRGVLASDLLRAAATVPGFRRALRLCLVESSTRLRHEQEMRLRDAQPLWVTQITDLPEGPILLVANEFLDALPVRQFVRGSNHWSERMVGLDPAGDLTFINGPETPAATLIVPESLRSNAPGTIAEVCPAALALAAGLGARLVREPGAALLIDYGYFSSAPGPTLRAVSRHSSIGVLVQPGCSDLSAHVDFAAFSADARAAGADTYGPVTQGRFLQGLGAEARLAGLKLRASPDQRYDLESGLRRLMDPDEMGDLFKAVALASPGLPRPAGFDTDPIRASP